MPPERGHCCRQRKRLLFVVKEAFQLVGIARWRSDWAKLSDWRINPALFQYYVDYAEEAVPWVISRGIEEGITPIEFLTDSSIHYDDGSLVAVCDATQESNQSLMVALANRAEQNGAILLRNALRSALCSLKTVP